MSELTKVAENIDELKDIFKDNFQQQIDSFSLDLLQESKKSKSSMIQRNTMNKATNLSPRERMKFAEMSMKLQEASQRASLQNMRTNEEKPKPVTTTLPAVRPTSVMARDTINVDWTDVNQLPGSNIAFIKKLGQQVFSSFESNFQNEEFKKEMVTVDKVLTVASHHDSPLLNEHREMNAIMHWLETVGEPIVGHGDDMEVDFSNTIEGYKAQVKCYAVGNVMFKAVNDFMGRYIYAWESNALARKLENKYSTENDNKIEERKKIGRKP